MQMNLVPVIMHRSEDVEDEHDHATMRVTEIWLGIGDDQKG
jgi:hypothetical protein